MKIPQTNKPFMAQYKSKGVMVGVVIGNVPNLKRGLTDIYLTFEQFDTLIKEYKQLKKKMVEGSWTPK